MINLFRAILAISLVAILASCGGGGDGADYAPPLYGAIALNRTNGAAAMSLNHEWQSDANDAAVRKCGTNCVKVLEFGSYECAALARGSNLAFGWANNSRKPNAENDARDQCVAHGGLNCVVKLSDCNSG